MSTVLVTGGAGYVGAHTCKALREAGYLPLVIDNLSTGHKGFVQWGPLIEGDIQDTGLVAQTIRSHHVDAVLHFAASAYVGESMTDPQKYYESNVAGSLSLLKAMRQTGCHHIVFSSTCAVYGEPADIPIREQTPKDPVNPYGASKLMIERILSDYARAYGLCYVALRYFNACGADPEDEIGELRDPETHLIPRAMMALQGHIDDFAVFGTDYETPDGTPIRDYIHVSDLADAHVAGLRRLLEGGESGAFNLGTGHGYSVKQVLAQIEWMTGERLTIEKGPRRPGDPPVLIADPSLANKELGFDPRRSDLKTVIATAWAWHRRAHPKKGNGIASKGAVSGSITASGDP
jgi:UDP-glucose-4-epimerase GalE